MVFRLFHHIAKLHFVKQRCYFTEQPAAGILLLFSVFKKLCKLFQFHNRFVVSDLHIVQRHIDDENNFLSQVVKSNNLVKKHQVHILEVFGIFHDAFYARFTVPEVII